MSGHVLVVDDEPGIRDVLVQVLTEEGYGATCARNGREALAAILADPPLLILLDFQMPVMDGGELLDALEIAHSIVPVVLLSATGNIQAATVRYHAAGYLAKPFDLDELLAMISSHLSAGTQHMLLAPAVPAALAETAHHTDLLPAA